MPLVIKQAGLDEFLDTSGGAWIKTLVLGEPGAGKTPFAAQWPQPIFAMCEQGIMSVARNKVPYADIYTSADMDALLDMLKLDSKKPNGSRKYRTLVIDTFDNYQRRLMQERLKSERKEAFSGHGDWGWLDGKMIQLIERLVELPMNVVVNMHVRDVEDGDEDNRIQVKRAKLKGDIKDSVWQDFDLIGMLEKSYVMEGGERVQKRQIRWWSEPRYPTLRDRSGLLPRFTDVDFTENDFIQIYEAISNGLDDIPESEVLEELEVLGDGDEVPPPDVAGGPVADPALPRPPAAKKAAAKKTTAKKAAAPAAPKTETPVAESVATPVAEPVSAETPVDESPGVPAEDPWAPPATEPSDSNEQLDEALSLLGAEQISEEPNDPSPAPAVGAVAEPPAPPAPPADEGDDHGKASAGEAPARDYKVCGDQPAAFVGKHEPVPGCGRRLDADNATRAQISMIKLRTYLCDDCNAAQSK